MAGSAGLAAVSDAVDRGAFTLAIDLLAGCGAEQASAQGLELRARALYGAGDFERSVAAWEDLHALLISENDRPGAALAAATVAMFLLIDTGLMAAVRGWSRRAEQLLVGHDEGPAHAVIAAVRSYERFMCGDMAAAREHSTSAINIGGRFGVAPAVVIGRVCAARVTIFEGQVDEGFALLDDIAVDLMAGAADPITTGMMYCELICAAQGMALHERVIEWTDVMDRWRRGSAIGSVNGRCRVHRAEILRISGTCEAAEQEALQACAELRPWLRREFGWPLVELGNVRLRKGDLIGAEESFLAAHERAWSPHPGLALLRMEQGDTATATAMIAEAIANPFDIPSKERPPFGDLRLAPLLDAQSQIAATTGDIDTLRAATAALCSIADTYPSPSLAAGATLAQARLSLTCGDTGSAIRHAAGATAAWAAIGAPFESAAARMVLGEARHAAGDSDGARMEWRAAHSTFVAFGAQRWAVRAQHLADSTRVDAETRSSSRVAQATFRLDGNSRTIEFDGVRVTMRDLLGYRYISRLLADPEREFHVLDLIAVERGSLPIGNHAETKDGVTTSGGQSGLPVLDDQARNAYRRRLADVDEDIEDAERMNDIGRIDLARRDRDYLIAELSRAVGLGTRLRTTGGQAERARTSVARSMRYALRQLAAHHPILAAHLDQAVHTGVYCDYTGDPTAPLNWNL